MTCIEIVALLDGYTDNDLNGSDHSAVSDHLKQCPACRAEYQSTLKLKELLKVSTVQSPGEDYFRETAGLILARTIESAQGTSVQPRSVPIHSDRRRAFFRSLISAAASVTILISALLVGADHKRQPMTANNNEHQVLVSSVLAGRNTTDADGPSVREEQLRLVTSMFLTGPPGLLGGHVGLSIR
jgi:anti-sigma factor RsiW